MRTLGRKSSREKEDLDGEARPADEQGCAGPAGWAAHQASVMPPSCLSLACPMTHGHRNLEGTSRQL